MELTEHNVSLYIDNYSSDIDEVINSNIVDREKLYSILSEFDNISAFIISKKSTPDDVKTFLSEEYLNPDSNISNKYIGLKSIFKLKSYIKNIAEKEIKKALKNKDYSKVISELAMAITTDIKNIVMFEYIIDLLKEKEQFKKIIELYRMMFVYTLNPMYFEKIGDAFADMNNYQEAIDSYLSCAEYTDNYAEIYEKLAEMFKKVNDEESRIACLKQVDAIRGENG